MIQLKDTDRTKIEFVSIASHQLRTPLTAIKLFTEMLTRNEAGKLLPKQQEYVNDIHESTERMIKLVNDLLNISRLETGQLKIEPKLTQLEQVITEIIAEFESLVKAKNGKITFTKPKKLLPLIPLDGSLLRQVIYNLVDNAFKYVATGKPRVSVVLTTTGLSPSATTLVAKQFGCALEALGPTVLISITDNGIGIPKVAQSRIFEKFFRADNVIKIAVEGAGLGLYVAKMITEASGGQLWFESTDGKGLLASRPGTTFYIIIPLAGMSICHGEKRLV